MAEEVQSSQQVAEELLRLAAVRFQDPKSVWGIPWSGSAGQFPTLDKQTGGIEKSMYVLVSRPNVGKSALAAQVTINAAEWVNEQNDQRNHRDLWVGLITSEMASTAYQRRMACIMSGVDNNTVKNGFLDIPDYKRQQTYDSWVACVNYIAKLPIRFLSGTVSVDEIVRFCFGTRSHPEQCAFFILDHIGLVTDNDNQANSRALETVSKRLRNLCQNAVPGLILGHLNRATEQTVDKEPTLGNVAGADQISRDADWVLALHRPDLYKKESEELPKDRVYGKLKILKARDGSTDEIDMWYNKRQTFWSESK